MINIITLSCLDVKPKDYLFTKYNVQPTSYTYSLEEYTRLLEGKCFRNIYGHTSLTPGSRP